MDSISMGRFMDSLGVNSFKREQLDIIDKHEKFINKIYKVEFLFALSYPVSCLYDFYNPSDATNLLVSLLLFCNICLPFVFFLDSVILKFKLKRSLEVI